MNETQSSTVEVLNFEKVKELVAPLLFLCILLIIGIPGNFTVLVIYYRKYSHCVYRTIILNLGILDFLVSFFGIPFNIARLIYFYTFTDIIACKFFTSMLTFGFLYSAHLIMLLSFHRFRQVCMPLKWQITIQGIHFWIAACFIIAVLFSWPQVPLINIEQIPLTYNLSGSICPVTPEKENQTKYWTVYNAILLCQFAFYTVLLLVIYLLIAVKIYFQNRSVQNLHIPENSGSRIHASRMTKIAFTITLVFALSFVTLFMLKVAKEWFNEKDINPVASTVLRIAERLYMVNHVANPFIYAAFDKTFRKHFVNIFCRYRQIKTQQSESSESTHLQST